MLLLMLRWISSRDLPETFSRPLVEKWTKERKRNTFRGLLVERKKIIFIARHHRIRGHSFDSTRRTLYLLLLPTPPTPNCTRIGANSIHEGTLLKLKTNRLFKYIINHNFFLVSFTSDGLPPLPPFFQLPMDAVPLFWPVLFPALW